MNNIARQYRVNRIELSELESPDWPEPAIPLDPGSPACAPIPLPSPLFRPALLPHSLTGESWETTIYAVMWVCGLVAIMLSVA